MARKRTINRIEKRADYEAYERRKQEDEDPEAEDEEDDDEAEASDEAEEAEDEVEEEAPVRKKKPAEPKPKRTRTPKQVRQKVVWAVFDNSSRRVQTFDYSRKKDAEEYAAKMQADKKSTYYVQPVKEPMEDK
jgi:hypothetical protein